MSIELEVSLGEALDKLSILDIKLEKIKDERKNDVYNEYNYLKTKLKKYILLYNYFYTILKKVNLEIWELQDIIRSDSSTKSFYSLCNEILNLNDSRYLVKKKINEICCSKLKEQKGYNLRNLNIILNVSDEILDNLNGAIRYYSFYYDNIYIYCNIDKINLIKKIYNDDLFIKINNINEYNENNNDYIKINNYEIEKKISHTYFKDKQIENNNSNYSYEINKLYENLNLNIKIYDGYRYIYNN